VKANSMFYVVWVVRIRIRTFKPLAIGWNPLDPGMPSIGCLQASSAQDDKVDGPSEFSIHTATI